MKHLYIYCEETENGLFAYRAAEKQSLQHRIIMMGLPDVFEMRMAVMMICTFYEWSDSNRIRTQIRRMIPGKVQDILDYLQACGVDAELLRMKPADWLKERWPDGTLKPDELCDLLGIDDMDVLKELLEGDNAEKQCDSEESWRYSVQDVQQIAILHYLRHYMSGCELAMRSLQIRIREKVSDRAEADRLIKEIQDSYDSMVGEDSWEDQYFFLNPDADDLPFEPKVLSPVRSVSDKFRNSLLFTLGYYLKENAFDYTVQIQGNIEKYGFVLIVTPQKDAVSFDPHALRYALDQFSDACGEDCMQQPLWYTTREKRDASDTAYIFVDDCVFNLLAEEGDFIYEWQAISARYALSYREIERILDSSGCCYLGRMTDPDLIRKLKEKYPIVTVEVSGADA